MNYQKIKNLSNPNKGVYGIGASSCDYNSKYPQYLRITDIDDNGYAPYTLETCINPNLYKNWNKYVLNKNDIVFARTGNSTGRIFFCKNIKPNTVFAGFLIKFSIDPTLINPQYLGYYCQSKSYWNQVSSLFTGSTRNNINAEQYGDLLIPVVDDALQQHIVNTIGSVDDLLENLVKQNEKIIQIGIIKINKLNNIQTKNLSEIVEFSKGCEVGSSNYSDIKKDNMINYLRVGDLNAIGTTHVKLDNELVISKFDDILCAFDGAPGRNNIGLVGAYSSGIYNLKCNDINKGLVYFEINSDLNQKIIADHSQGTTILHASKSIQHLQYADIGLEDKMYLNSLFKLLLQNKNKIEYLKNIKSNLLNKYF
ncbi:restriction endonuclease subunit S [Mycoplasmopsis arginini]|uniref:restriction endonuclease subunit S n=1 Tax=Mycoplasmopsis arginini TaxID=2094 RepID=UPI0005C27008|nr:restriction endonuclease subunit S [Mycoplasmopsis arginini]BAQ54224.1 hypothetical protein MARG145_0065 [Mycoplasmopsis arginini]